MTKFYEGHGNRDLWLSAGFQAPLSYNSMYLRFCELEEQRYTDALDRAADKLVQIAREQEPRIGQVVHVDATAFHSRAVLHHDCPDAATCAAAGGRVPSTVRVASEELVKTKRREEAQEPPTEGRFASEALKPARKQAGRYKNYVQLSNGHRYGSVDPDAGCRMYAHPDGSTKAAWIGGFDVGAVDGFTGGLLTDLVIPANRQELKAFPALLRRLERTLGARPQAITADRGYSFERAFEVCTRREITAAFAFRVPHWSVEREDICCEAFDEHGVPRCKFCGGPGSQEAARCGMQYPNGKPRLHFRCISGETPDCITVRQSIDPAAHKYGWRALLPLSRLGERYHALRAAHQHFEATWGFQRERYGRIGDNEAGKLQRLGLGAQRLRAAAARFLEWFRICLRHGWIGDYARRNDRDPISRRGDRRLKTMLRKRRDRGLNLPYGKAAHALGLAASPDLPPKLKLPRKGAPKKARGRGSPGKPPARLASI